MAHRSKQKQRRSYIKKYIALILLVLTVAGLLWYCSGSEAEEDSEPQKTVQAIIPCDVEYDDIDVTFCNYEDGTESTTYEFDKITW